MERHKGPLRVNSRLSIPASEIQVDYARSPGPGGQAVNKKNTKVVLRFSVLRSQALGERRRAILSKKLDRRLTKEGELVLHASRFRERSRNEEDARERLAEILRDALTPTRARRATRPTRASRERRLDQKKKRGDLKRSRRGWSE